MKLTEDEFNDALRALRCGEYCLVTESRGRARVPMGTRVSIVPVAEMRWGESETVVLLNISETGVCILNASPLDVGDTFILCLPSVGPKAAAMVLCTVVRSQTFATGIFASGAQFTRFLDPREASTDGPVFKTIEEIEDLDLSQIRQVEARLRKFEIKLD